MTGKESFLMGGMIAAVLAVCILVGSKVREVGGEKYPHSSMLSSVNDVYEQGARAYTLEVIANANPYVGTDHKLADVWLQGYLDKKEGKK